MERVTACTENRTKSSNTLCYKNNFL